MDLEIPRADRRLHPAAVAAGVGERLGHRGLARAEEAQTLQHGRPRAAEHAPHRLGLERAGPEPPELARRARENDRDGVAGLEDEARRRSGETERQRALGDRRLLAHPGLEIDVRTPQPLGEAARDRLDLPEQVLVDPQADPRRARHDLDGAVVMRRAKPSGHDAEFGLQPLGDRRLQFLLPGADDRNTGRLQPEAQELAGDEGAVQVGAVTTDELAAGDDDVAARARGHTAGLMPRGVTISVLTPPTGRCRTRPFRTIFRFSGRSSVIQSRLPVNSWSCPFSSVPW